MVNTIKNRSLWPILVMMVLGSLPSITHADPDLIVDDIFVSNTSPCTNETIVYYIVVKNIGDSPVATARDDQFHFTVWWSIEPTQVRDNIILLDFLPYEQANGVHPSLGPGETAVCTLHGIAPSGHSYYWYLPHEYSDPWIPHYSWNSPGTYYLNASVDDWGEVDEWDEGNNYLSSEPINVSSSNPPSQFWNLLKSVLNSGVACDPVNTANGNYIHESTDITLPGIGLDFVFKRTYNSQEAEYGYAALFSPSNNSSLSRPLGYGWTHSYNMYVQELGASRDTLLVHMGSNNLFFNESSGNYTPKYPGVFHTLTKGGGRFYLTDKMQTIYTFDTERTVDGILRYPLVRIEDRNGHAIDFNLDPNGRIDSVTDTVGRTVKFYYDDVGLRLGRLARVREESFAPNREVTFSYDTTGVLTTCTNVRGGVTQYEYDSHWRLTRVVDPRGNTMVHNTYDAYGRVTTQENGRGKSTTISYDLTVKETTITDPKSNATVQKHGDRFRLLWTKNPDNNSTTYEYDTDGNITRRIDPKGNETIFTYDSRGNMLSKTQVGSGGPSIVTNYTYHGPSDGKKVNLIQTMTEAVGTADERTTQYEYDSNGNLTREYDSLGDLRRIEYYSEPPKMGLPQYSYDGNGHGTEFQYDDYGRTTRISDPEGKVRNFSFNNPLGTQKIVTDGNGNATVYDYDAAMNIVSVTDPEGHITSYKYDGNGNLTETRDPRGQSSGRSTTYDYDENNNLTKITASDGGVTGYTYDDNDNKDSETDQGGNPTGYVYDAMDRMTSKTDPEGNTTTYGYDSNGNLTSITTPDGRTTIFTYNERDLQTNTTDPLGNQTVNTYDSLDRLISVTDARGKTTQYAYNVRDQLVSVTDTLGGVTSYSYDGAGNLTAIADAKDGQTATMEYYSNNLLQKKTDALGNSFTYEYDGAGNQTAVVDAKGDRTGFDYWPDNKLKTISYPTGPPVTFSYDASGNRIQMTDSTGTTMYSYDEMNRLISTTDPFGLTVSYTYFQTGKRRTTTYPGAKIVSYTYDELNRLKTVTDWLGGATTYAYATFGLLTRAAFPNGTYEERDYDASHRLVYLANKKSDGSVICSYGYTLDPLGNPVGIDTNQPLQLALSSSNTTYEYDVDDRLTVAGGVSRVYDNNGNLTAKTGTNPATYTYDYEDRLTSVSTPNQNWTYTYDGVGNRISKLVGGTTTRYLLDRAGELENVIAEMDASNNVVAYYVHGAGLISKITPSGDRYVYHYDRSGNTIAITDSSEELANQYVYTPFGTKTGETETLSNDFEFVGKYGVMHEDNNLLFMRARFYEQNTGRFLSKDPIVGEFNSPQSLHHYIYAANNPLVNIDPSGLYDWGLLASGVLGTPSAAIKSAYYTGLSLIGIGGSALSGALGDQIAAEQYHQKTMLMAEMARDEISNWRWSIGQEYSGSLGRQLGINLEISWLHAGTSRGGAEDYVSLNPQWQSLYQTEKFVANVVTTVKSFRDMVKSLGSFSEAGGIPQLDKTMSKIEQGINVGSFAGLGKADMNILVRTLLAGIESLQFGGELSEFSERMPKCKK